jgi:hypothetical protein
VSETIDQVRRLIGSRLAELEAETRKLEAALLGLGEESPRKPGSTRVVMAGSSRPTAARRPKRAVRGRRRDELLAAIGANPGARPAELAKAVGIRSTQVHALIAKARAEKLIKKRGKGYALKA